MFQKLTHLFARIRVSKIYKSHTNASSVQEQIRRSVLNSMNGTRFVDAHPRIRESDYDAFVRDIPCTTYEDIASDIEAMLADTPSVRFPGVVEMFSRSSGTTNDKSKYIPLPKKALLVNHYGAGKDMLALYLARNPKSKLLYGKTLSIIGSLSPSPFGGKALVGDVSAILATQLPIWARKLRAPSVKTALIPNWEEKAKKIIEEESGSYVTGLAGTPTWVSVILHRVCDTTKKPISEIWPDLEVFFHGAVSFVPYQPIFKDLLSESVQYVEIYNASEGFFAVQDDPMRPGEMLLLLNRGIFYEFIPMSEFGKPHAKALRITEVEIGVQYALIITTYGGLVRYSIGDTIRFTSREPYRIVITGRTKHFLNTFGEELVIEQVERAIASACLETNAKIKNFTVAPKYMEASGGGAHEWIIEFLETPRDQGKFESLIDSTLRAINSDYDAKRTGDQILKQPIFTYVPENTFYNWMASRQKLGGQHKVPPLSNTREYAESILGMK